MFFLDDPIKQRTTLVYKGLRRNVEYAKIDRMFVRDDPIKQRTTLVYKRSKTKCRVYQDRQDVLPRRSD